MLAGTKIFVYTNNYPSPRSFVASHLLNSPFPLRSSRPFVSGYHTSIKGRVMAAKSAPKKFGRRNGYLTEEGPEMVRREGYY